MSKKTMTRDALEDALADIRRRVTAMEQEMPRLRAQVAQIRQGLADILQALTAEDTDGDPT